MQVSIINTLVVSLYFVSMVDSRVRPLKGRSFEGDIDMSRQDMNRIQTEILFTGKVYSINIWKDGKIPFIISNKFGNIKLQLDINSRLNFKCIHK